MRESNKSTKHTNPKYEKHMEEHHASHLDEELQKVQSVGYLKQYIIDVINHGSKQLHFKSGEVM